MANPKHTPGPWHLANDQRIYSLQMRAVADMVHFSAQSRGEDAANAQLIAAAPELLSIAQAYRNLLKTMAHTEGQVATFQHIESVIAKATGGIK